MKSPEPAWGGQQVARRLLTRGLSSPCFQQGGTMDYLLTLLGYLLVGIFPYGGTEPPPPRFP